MTATLMKTDTVRATADSMRKYAMASFFLEFFVVSIFLHHDRGRDLRPAGSPLLSKTKLGGHEQA